MSDNLRYWDRVGMYVTRDFAEDWAEKLKAGGDGTRGKFLDSETEEYILPAMVSIPSIQREIEDIFSRPFEKVQLPADTQAILKVTEMERERVKRIKQLKSDGYSLEEAKALVTSEINQAVAEIMGIDIEEFAEDLEVQKQLATKGAEAQEASVDDSEE
jgi:protein-disulfide isomerase-like protein with CxxC motif